VGISNPPRKLKNKNLDTDVKSDLTASSSQKIQFWR
jgi:hypothetical protein